MNGIARVIAIIVLLLFLGIPAGRAEKNSIKQEGSKMTAAVESLRVKSNSIKPGEMIPKKYTCDGEDISPQISWDNTPKGTKELVLICDDPDAPMATWVHWVVYGIPPNLTSLPENVLKRDSVSGYIQGKNSFGKVGYNGPCPPRGSAHRYFFKLYAVDKPTNLKPGATKDEVLKAIEGYILTQGELIGCYSR